VATHAHSGAIGYKSGLLLTCFDNWTGPEQLQISHIQSSVAESNSSLACAPSKSASSSDLTVDPSFYSRSTCQPVNTSGNDKRQQLKELSGQGLPASGSRLHS